MLCTGQALSTSGFGQVRYQLLDAAADVVASTYRMVLDSIGTFGSAMPVRGWV